MFGIVYNLYTSKFLLELSTCKCLYNLYNMIYINIILY